MRSVLAVIFFCMGIAAGAGLVKYARDGYVLALILALGVSLAFVLALLLTWLEETVDALTKSYEDGAL